MSLDLTKYRTVFIEEATEHLSEMSSALLFGILGMVLRG